jgi:hypothetical protein
MNFRRVLGVSTSAKIYSRVTVCSQRWPSLARNILIPSSACFGALASAKGFKRRTTFLRLEERGINGPGPRDDSSEC